VPGQLAVTPDAANIVILVNIFTDRAKSLYKN